MTLSNHHTEEEYQWLREAYDEEQRLHAWTKRDRDEVMAQAAEAEATIRAAKLHAGENAMYFDELQQAVKDRDATIERLTKSRDVWRESSVFESKQRVELQATIERLRALIQRLADTDIRTTREQHMEGRSSMEEQLVELVYEARAALQQAKDERDGLQAWAEKREVRLTEAEATIERLTEDLTMRTDDLDRAAVTIERLRADLAASAADCDEAIAQETERLRGLKQTADDAVDLLTAANDDMQATIERLTEERELVYVERDAALEEIGRLRATLERLMDPLMPQSVIEIARAALNEGSPE